MFGGNSRQRDLYARQFEPDGDGYIFRLKLADDGIRVTAAERDRFINAYVRGMNLTIWLLLPAFILLSIGVIVWEERVFPRGEAPTWIGMIGGLIMLPIVWARAFWLFKAPIRELGASRNPVPGYSKADARRIALSRLELGQAGGRLSGCDLRNLAAQRRSSARWLESPVACRWCGIHRPRYPPSLSEVALGTAA